MKRLIIAAALIVGMLPTAALATEDISVGCLDEVTGEAGLRNATGECITPAEYDALFSFENLSTIPSIIDPTVSIAEEAGLVDDGVPASERILGAGVSDPFTFREVVNGIRAL